MERFKNEWNKRKRIIRVISDIRWQKKILRANGADGADGTDGANGNKRK